MLYFKEKAMKKVNKSRYAVLGILFDKPHSGYSILSMMKQSTTHFWQESDASVYPMLRRLEAEGKVTSSHEATGKRERIIFEITQSGKDEFLAWLTSPTAKESYRNEFMLKLFFGAFTEKKTLIDLLKTKQAHCKELDKIYQNTSSSVLEKLPDTHQHKLYWIMALRFGQLHNDAEQQWIVEYLERLSKVK